MEKHSYNRSALLFDSDDYALSRTSLSLIALGHRPYYANDIDELILVAREYRDLIGALVLPAARAFEWWPLLRKRVVDPIGLAPCSVLPVGPPLSESETTALHIDGLRWSLRDPFSPQELRFAVSMVLSASDPDEPRIEARVPCAIAADIGSQGRVVQGRLTDLSPGGAFVQLDRPHLKGTRVVLRVVLCGRLVSLAARVAWRTDAQAPKWRARGMGVEFTNVGLETLGLLRRHAKRALDRFRLSAASLADGDPGASTQDRRVAAR